MENSKPVPEAVYEELKMIAATKERCVLQFQATNGGVSTLETRLMDVFEDADGQFLLGENGFVLSLPQIISINGKPLDFYC